MDHKSFTTYLNSLEAPTSSNLIQLGKWIEETAMPWLWQEMAGVVLEPVAAHPLQTKPSRPRTLSPINGENAIRHGLAFSIADQTRLPTEAKFYHAQLSMLSTQASRYCERIKAFDSQYPQGIPDAPVFMLHRPLVMHMRYARVLLESAGALVAGVPAYYGAWSNPFDSSFEIYKASEQAIYGSLSGMAHTDLAPSVPIAILRTAIELRMRDAFCVQGLIDPNRPDELIPLDMSKLFAAIQKHAGSIDFAVDFHDIWRVYRWSNFYLHAGRRDYPWVAGFVLGYVHPLLAGKPKSTSIHSGISMSREVWHKVRAELQPKQNRFLVRLSTAWGILFPRNKGAAILPPAKEEDAQCAFLS